MDIEPERRIDVQCLYCANEFFVEHSSSHPGDAHLQGREEAVPEKRKPVAALSVPARLQLVFMSTVLLFLALGFNALLSLTTLENLYLHSIISQYRVVGKHFQSKLEKSIRFGKSLSTFHGMENFLEESSADLIEKINRKGVQAKGFTKSVAVREPSVSIALLNRKIRYSTDPLLVGRYADKKLIAPYENPSGADEEEEFLHYVKMGNDYVTSLPVYKNSFHGKTLEGVILMSFDEKQVTALLHSVLLENATIVVILVLVTAVVLFIFLNIRWIRKNKETGVSKRKIGVVLFLVIALSQVVFTGVNTFSFQQYYMKINKEKTQLMAKLLKEDIEYLISKGLQLHRLRGLDKMLAEIIRKAPELDNITLFDNEGRPLYIANKDEVTNFKKALKNQPDIVKGIADHMESGFYHLEKIMHGKEVEGYIETDVDEGYITSSISTQVMLKKLFGNVLDSATVLLVSLLFLTELLVPAFHMTDKKKRDAATENGYRIIRPGVFLFVFAMHISITFIPLHAQYLYQEVSGISKYFVFALPVSMEMLFACISIIPAWTWMKKTRWQNPFYTGLFLCCAGFVYCFFAPGMAHYLLARALAGMGFGLVLIVFYRLMMNGTVQNEKSKGISHFLTGFCSGSICGAALGAMIAERVGFRPVFLAGSGLVLITLLYAVLFLQNSTKTRETDRSFLGDENAIWKTTLFQVATGKKILYTLVFITIPVSCAVSGFIYFTMPVHLESLDISLSSTGRIFMLSGIPVILFFPGMMRSLSGASKHTRNQFLLAAAVMGGGAFALLFFFSNASATALAVFLLGSVTCIFLAFRYAVVINQTGKREGEEEVCVFAVAQKAGQMAGPPVFAWLFFSGDMASGALAAGGAYLVFFLLFFVVTRKTRASW